MGIFSKIYSGVQNAISTDQGKVITGFAYGIGASIVIIGALFKILHLQGAEEMLMLGMGTEAFLFALGAFEAPHKEHDWSVVYPELAYGHGNEHTPVESTVAQGKKGNAGAQMGSLGDISGLTSEDIEKLKDGLSKLSKTASQMNDISGASIATENYIKNIEKAATSADHFADVQNKGIESISTASNQLMTAYSNSAQSLEKSISDLGKDSAQISSTLSTVSGNLTKINSVYELQLQTINQQLEEAKAELAETKKINTNLGTISKNYSDSVADVEAYKNEAAKLKKQISDLNAVYGNMLNALNIES
ncbi:gliding motility protein GldL [Saccharicrinis sp. FJH62]|uniref:type IX secretion system motor protein PorL/GldL n=1 Tax=Saccharicrinis sp. FJH62 TaxID=3344657 RepID=UPI0035D3E048